MVLNFIALAIYCIFAFICLCDGFGVAAQRKIGWGVVLLLSVYASIRLNNSLSLGLILPIPTLFAIYLCLAAKRNKK